MSSGNRAPYNPTNSATSPTGPAWPSPHHPHTEAAVQLRKTSTPTAGHVEMRIRFRPRLSCNALPISAECTSAFRLGTGSFEVGEGDFDNLYEGRLTPAQVSELRAIGTLMRAKVQRPVDDLPRAK